MIIGDGLIAKALKASSDLFSDALILAAGVSNSAEERPDAFDRERNLIAAQDSEGRTVVYFSTVSIYDPARSHTHYVRYKRETEQWLLDRFERVLVLRLPIVLSMDNNPNQLFGHLRSKLRNKERLYLYRNASRYLFHVADVPVAVRMLLDRMEQEGLDQLAVNVGFGIAVTMPQIGEAIRAHFPQSALEMVDEGASYAVDFSSFERWADETATPFRSRDPKAMVHEFFNALKDEE